MAGTPTTPTHSESVAMEYDIVGLDGDITLGYREARRPGETGTGSKEQQYKLFMKGDDMRGTVAKRLRNAAREKAANIPTEYRLKRMFKALIGKKDDKGKPIGVARETVFCTGFRRIYQDMKRAYIHR
jgi:hypothetical protein